MKKILVLFVLLMPIFAYAEFDEGVEYLKLVNPQPTADNDKIEVLEFFWYGCPHCYQFEPEVHAWLENKPDDVVFVRIPAVFRPSWELHARAFYTAQILGVLDKVHQPLFDQIHKQRKQVRTVEDVKQVFIAQGVSGPDFDSTYNSFAVITRTNRAKQAGDVYNLRAVPTLVVNGKYRTTAKLAGGKKQMIEVVDFLVEKERKLKADGAQPASQAQ